MLLGFLVAPVFGAELKLRPPPKPFSSYKAPPAPDYANKESWAVWPGRASPADQIPPGIDGTTSQESQGRRFLHSPDDVPGKFVLERQVRRRRFYRDSSSIKPCCATRSSVFNGCCRMYAPRYRQATLSAFLNPGADANKSFDSGLFRCCCARSTITWRTRTKAAPSFSRVTAKDRCTRSGCCKSASSDGRKLQTPRRRLCRRRIAARDDRTIRGCRSAIARPRRVASSIGTVPPD